MKLLVKQNATSVLASVFVQDSSSGTGAGLTGLAYNAAGLTAYYFREGDAAATAISLATMTVGTWASGGLKLVDNTNTPGLVQLGLPNACFTALGSVIVYLFGATNMVPTVLEIQVVAFDPKDGVHLGLTCLPNTACTTNGSLITSGSGTDQLSVSGGRAKADVSYWSGSAVAAPNVAGYPLVDVKYILGTLSQGAAGSVSPDWNAIRNPTTAVNLSGTTISTSQRVDVNTIKTQSVTCAAGVTVGAFVGNATAALSVDASGRIDVGSILGTASQGAAGYVGIDWSKITNPTATVNLSGTTVASAGSSYSPVILSGTASAGGGNTITLASGPSTDNLLNGARVELTGGTGADQAAVIIAYNHSTLVATVDRPWVTAPDNTTTYRVVYEASPIGTQIEAGTPAVNLRQAISIIGAYVAGLLNGVNTNTPAWKGLGTSTTRISGTTDNTGRTSVTLTPPS